MKIDEECELNRSLKTVSTLGIGGPAKYFLEVHTLQKMADTIAYCSKNQLPYFILGKGSNTLFDDQGFDGIVIANKIDFIDKPSDEVWHVGAGYSFSLLGSQTARQGYTGLEFASGIPGSVGGAVYMNAGANGSETSETLIEVDYVTPEGKLKKIPREELSFSYRHSSFQSMQGAIVGATFRLTPASTAREKQLKIIEYRKNTQPYSAKSAGCVFRNPSCHFAGALIERCGLKGSMIGGAQVSDVHANFIINHHEATSKDVLALINHVRQKVKEETGIDLESEVKCIPFQPKSLHE